MDSYAFAHGLSLQPPVVAVHHSPYNRNGDSTDEPAANGGNSSSVGELLAATALVRQQQPPTNRNLLGGGGENEVIKNIGKQDGSDGDDDDDDDDDDDEDDEEEEEEEERTGGGAGGGGGAERGPPEAKTETDATAAKETSPSSAAASAAVKTDETKKNVGAFKKGRSLQKNEDIYSHFIDVGRRSGNMYVACRYCATDDDKKMLLHAHLIIGKSQHNSLCRKRPKICLKHLKKCEAYRQHRLEQGLTEEAGDDHDDDNENYSAPVRSKKRKQSSSSSTTTPSKMSGNKKNMSLPRRLEKLEHTFGSAHEEEPNPSIMRRIAWLEESYELKMGKGMLPLDRVAQLERVLLGPNKHI